MNFKSKIIAFLVLALLFFSSCSVTRKISAAQILSQTKLNFESLTLDTIRINKDIFPEKVFMGFLPNPQIITMAKQIAKGEFDKDIGTADMSVVVSADNGSKDTLWIHSMLATVKLDSLMELPINLKDPLLLLPGENSLTFTTQVNIDKRLFHLMDVNYCRMIGTMEVSLAADGKREPLDFDIKRDISKDEKQELADRARETIFDSIVQNVLGGFFPAE